MIASSDALLMFSNYENFPCVIAESMMSGKPVISSNVNGIPEHVYEENGILVDPRDEEALGNAIVAFTTGELGFDSKKIRAYAMEHFSYKGVGEKFTNIYRSIL
jgi:glycosyltransferase involved in cell wall biosynthesis